MARTEIVKIPIDASEFNAFAYAPQGTGVTVLVINQTGGNAAIALSQLGSR